MDNVSFQSGIKPISRYHFNRMTVPIGESRLVDYPWTTEQSLLKEFAYTTGVADCTVCGITDGNLVLLNHINPSKIENYNFDKIRDFLLEKIDLMDKRYLQGFLLGSQGTDITLSGILFNNFKQFLGDLKIPTSLFRKGNWMTDVAYSAEKDMWYISNERVPWKVDNSKELLNIMFEEVKISPLDTII